MDIRQFAGSTKGDERVSGPFYIGRSSFRMGVVEGDVVIGQVVGGHTPARGIGYFPIDADDEWEVSSVRDREEAPPVLAPGSPWESFWEEDEATTVFANTDASPASGVTTRPVVAVIAAAGLVGGVLALTVGLTTRFSSASIGRAVTPLLRRALSEEQPRSASAPLSLSTSPELSCEGETFEPPAVTTEVAPPDVPGISASNTQRRSPKRSQRTPSPRASTSAAGWVDPWAD